MKNYREIINALLDGEILIDSAGFKCRLDPVTGELVNMICVGTDAAFPYPGDWRIYKEPNLWYENIPEGDVLCYASDDICKMLVPIIAYDPSDEWPFMSVGKRWINAIPLTEKEIQVFKDNAPEKL